MTTDAERWAAEYRTAGIPSSFRTEPSGAALWLFDQLAKRGVTSGLLVDLGCGRGRNSLAAAERGFAVTAIDFVCELTVALQEVAQKRGLPVTTHCQSVTEALPLADASVTAVMDIFVYKHQIAAAERAMVRQEVTRILQPGGFWMLSVADRADGYYGPLLAESPNPAAGIVTDPVTGVGSVLFTEEQLASDLAQGFRLIDQHSQRKPGLMHGQTYQRSTTFYLFQRANERHA
jgi:SAM-dependent methyltransferase